MTTLQQTLATYANGNKLEAFEMFKADETANPNISFDAFCKAFDNMVMNAEAEKRISNKTYSKFDA